MIELLKLTSLQIIFTVMILGIMFYFFRKILNQFICLELFPNVYPILPEKRKSFGEAARSVSLGLFVNNFPRFSIENGSFSIDGLVWFEFYPSQISIEDLEKFEFSEGKITKKSLAEIKKNNDKIFVAYSFEVEFISQLNYKKFPFADHRIFLILTHPLLSSNELSFYAEEKNIKFKSSLYPQGWKLEDTSIETGYSKIYLKNSDDKQAIFIPVAVFEFCFSKPGLRQLLLTVVPPLLLFYVALLSLIFDLSMTDSNSVATASISLTIGTMSAIIFHRFIIESLSPKVGYFTIVDYFYTIFLSFNFLIFVLHIYGVNSTGNHTTKYLSFYLIQIFLVSAFGFLLREKGRSHKKTINKPKEFFLSKFIGTPKIDTSNLKLSTYKKYAAMTDEFPSRDNINPLAPNYASYLKKKNTRQNLLRIFNHKKIPFHESAYFILKNTLSTLIKENFLEEKSSQRHVLLHPANAGEKFYIWGSLHGAFHSLIRSLAKLEELGIINNDFEILKDNHFFIFNGNAIEGSPYNLEILSLITSLMKINPRNIFYIKGDNEKRNLSLNLTLQEEIHIIEENYAIGKNSIKNLLDQFFYSLPETIYIKTTDGSNAEYITISSKNPILLDVDTLENSFEKCAHKNFATLVIKDIKDKSIASLISVQLHGFENDEHYKKLNGVDFLPFLNGSSTWSIVSSPIQAHKEYFDFHLDAYGILNIEPNFKENSISRLTCYFHAGESFIEEKFNLFSGAPIRDEDTNHKNFISEKEIRIGSSLDMAQTSSLLGERLKRGLDLRIRKANREGGVQEGYVRVFFENDNYNAAETIKVVNNLKENRHTNIMLSSLGTITTKAILPQAQNEEVFIAFPCTGSDAFRLPSLKNIVHYRTSYENEAIALVHYAKNTIFKQRFAFFYQEDDDGYAPLNAAKKLLNELYNVGHESFCEASYPRNTVFVENAAKIIENYNPDVIFFFSAHLPSQALIEKLGVQKLSNVTLMGTSFLTDRFRDFVSKTAAGHGKGLDFVISRVVPNPENSSIEIIKEYQKEMKKEYPRALFDVDSLEGYINASILLDVLENIPFPYTNADIIKNIELIQNKKFKGLDLNFNPQTRELSDNVWLDLGNGTWIKA